MEYIGTWTIEVRNLKNMTIIDRETHYNEKEAEQAARKLAKAYPLCAVFGYYNSRNGDVVAFNPGCEYGDPDPMPGAMPWH